MKYLKSFLFCLTCLISLSGYSQTPANSFGHRNGEFVPVGINYLKQKPIICREMIFPDIVNDIDSLGNGLLGIRLRKNKLSMKYNYVVFDGEKFLTKWSISGNYNKNIVNARNGKVFDIGINSLAYLNSLDGKLNYRINFHDLMHVTGRDLGLGYFLDSKKHPAGKLNILNLETGVSIGDVPVQYESGIDGLYFAHDSVVYISANGLHRIDLRNKSVWSHREETSQPPKLKLVLQEQLLTVWGDYTFNQYTYPSTSLKVHYLSSGVHLQNGIIYKTDSKKLFALDSAKLGVYWDVSLNEKQPSSAMIWSDDEFVYVLATGGAYYKGLFINYSKPILYKFTKKGASVYQVMLTSSSRVRYAIFDSTMVTIFHDDIISTYDLRDGKLKWETSTELIGSNTIRGIAPRTMGYIDAGKLIFTNEDENSIYLITSEELLRLNKDLYLIQKIPLKNTFNHVRNYKTYKLLYGEKLLSVMEGDKKILEFRDKSSIYLIGDNLYLTEKDKLFIVDLNAELTGGN